MEARGTWCQTGAMAASPARRGCVRRRGAIVLVGLLGLLGPRYRRWHLRWGATDEEVDAVLPGDDLLEAPPFRATRAITIDAAPRDVWQWLTQIGFGRAGFYAYDLLDNLGRPSARTVLPQFQRVAVGDVAAPMTDPARPGTSFTVFEVDEPHLLGWRKPDSTWVWRLTALPGGRTRLVTRLQTEYHLPGALLAAPLMELGDFPMMRKQLLGIKERAESTSERTSP